MSESQGFSAQEVIDGKATYKVGDILPHTHNSMETAYVIADYPYGRLRTLMRVWIETRPKMGQRVMEQTQNPKNGRWNKAHASTYSDIRGMVFDEKGHIEHHGWSMAYSGKPETEKFLVRFGAFLDEEQKCRLNLKLIYENKKDAGLTHNDAFKSAMMESGMLKRDIEAVKAGTL